MMESITQYMVPVLAAAPILLAIVVAGVHIMLSVFVGIGAFRRGRDGAGWGVFSLFISPMLAGFSLLMLGSKPRSR